VALVVLASWLSGNSRKVNVPTAEVPDISAFKTQIESALLTYGRGEYTYADVVKMVERNEAQFWPGKESAAITQILEYPNKKVLHFFIAVGNLAEMEACTPLICEWGKEQGCTAATLTGRRGWERTFMARQGWEPTLYTLEKAL
jgi:hypothetical protein